MKPITLGLLLIPLSAFAQPPAPYICTHMQTNPYTGAPASCEAVSDNVANPSFEYYFPQASNASADPPALSVPEVSGSGAIDGLVLLLGLAAILGTPRRRE